jgi:hypothetical protein
MPPVFAAIAYETVLLPAPLPLPVTVIQLALLFTVQPQELLVYTEMLPLLLLAVWMRKSGEMLAEHPDAWVTVNVLPAIVRIPVRTSVVLFAAMA